MLGPGGTVSGLLRSPGGLRGRSIATGGFRGRLMGLKYDSIVYIVAAMHADRVTYKLRSFSKSTEAVF